MGAGTFAGQSKRGQRDECRDCYGRVASFSIAIPFVTYHTALNES
jgi:hypothetical protein